MNKDSKAKESIKTQKGTVISVAGDKTIVVEVVTLKTHKKYVKKYKSSKIVSKIDISRNKGFNNISLFSYGGIMENNYWTRLKDLFVKGKDINKDLTN